MLALHEEGIVRLKPSDLLGPGEVCRVLGVSRATFMRYRQREDFPKPWVVLGIGPVWLAADIAAYAASAR